MGLGKGTCLYIHMYIYTHIYIYIYIRVHTYVHGSVTSITITGEALADEHLSEFMRSTSAKPNTCRHSNPWIEEEFIL